MKRRRKPQPGHWRYRTRLLHSVAQYAFGAVLCVAFSVLVVLCIQGVLEVEKFAPDWILWTVAAAALLLGLLLASFAVPWPATWARLLGRVRFALGIADLASFLILANWAAFGSGSRRGRSSFSLLGLAGAREAGELETRAVAAIGAIILDLIVAAAIVRDLRRFWATRSAARRPGRGARP